MMSPDVSRTTCSHARAGLIDCIAPFQFAHSLAFLRGFGPMVGEQAIAGGRVTKALVHLGQPILFTVEEAQPREAYPASGASIARLAYRLTSDRDISADIERAAAARIARLFSVDEDLSPFYARAEADAAFHPLTARLRGLHHVKFPSAFEAACWGAINQRIARPVARRMKDALCRRFGASAAVEGTVHWAFPEASALAGVSAIELASLLGHVRKAETIAAVARAFAVTSEDWLQTAPIDTVSRWLRAIHGVGPFTSGFVLYRGLGRFHGASIVSPHLVAAAERLYGRSLSAAGVSRIAESYGEWGGHWMLYLWASTFFPG